jgi:hypothetical protein
MSTKDLLAPLISLGLLLAACAHPAKPTPTIQAPTASCPRDGKIPLCLSLQTLGALRLRAMLTNVSSQPQVYLHDHRLQPSTLVLVGEDGKSVPLFDERSRQKFDNTPYKHLFETLAPGASVPLGELLTRKKGQGYALAWGPLTGTAKPGTYRAHLVFVHRQDVWVEGNIADPQHIKRGTFAGSFKGTLTSNTVTLTLP